MKTLKAVAARYNATSLILRIVIGLVVGAVLALAVPGAGWVEEFGSLFVGALKGIAPVLVFVIVAQGTSRLDRRFGTVIWLYMLTTFLAAAIAVVTSFLFPQTVVLAEAAESEVVPQGLGEVMNTLLTNFVANPVSALLNGNYIGILFWACLQRPVHLYPVRQAAAPAGGHHALYGTGRLAFYHLCVSALQPVSAGVPLPA